MTHNYAGLCMPCNTVFLFFLPFSSNTSTVDVNEASKFSLKESQWWDIRSGPLTPIHTQNTLRVPFIKEALLTTGKAVGATVGGATVGGTTSQPSAAPLQGYKILDVGCGGGILAEVSSSSGNATE